MLWRCKRSLLDTALRSPILKTIPFKSIHQITSPKVCASKHDFRNKCNPIILSPHIVHSTLLNCPSDLIALSFFIWCAKQRDYFHDVQSFDHMISVVSRLTERCETVRGIVGELESVGCVTKAKTFLLLLRIYWRGEVYEMVLEAFEEMGRFGFTPSTFARNIVMDALFKIGHVDVGIKVLRETQFPNFLSFSIALYNLCKLNSIVNVKDVIGMMLRNGFYPNVKTFGMILNCLCKMGRIAEAYQVLGLMTTLGISLSVNAWSVLIDGFCRLRRLDMAGDLWEKMVQNGCSPNVVTYTSLINGFCRLRRLDMAGYFWEKMVQDGCTPNVVTYTSLIKGFMEAKMFSIAFSFLDMLESEGHAPDLVFHNVLIDCLSKMGSYDDALDVFAGLLELKLVPDSYTFCSLLSVVCLSRRFSLLPKLVYGLEVEADLVVYNALLSYFCKAGFPNRTVELYNTMLDRGFTPDNYSFVGLLHGLCGARKIDEAVNVYKGILMNNPSVDAHVHTVIVDRLIKVGKCCKAIQLFRRAIIKKYPLDAVSYTIAIDGLLKGGKTEEAYTLYSQMKDIGVPPSAYTYRVMLYRFCKERNIKLVKWLLQDVIDARIELDCSTSIRLTKFIFKFHSSSPAVNQLVEMYNLGLIPDETMPVSLFDGSVPCVRAGDANHSLLNGGVEDNQFLGSSCSYALSDVAASMGQV